MSHVGSQAGPGRRCRRRLVAEALGTALLVTVVVGSGHRGRRSCRPTDVGLQLLENSTATVFGLAVLILIFGPVSGAHFNPVVSAADWLLGRRPGSGLPGREVLAYAVAQIVGGIAGALLANVDVRPAGGADLDEGPVSASATGSARWSRPPGWCC